MKANKKCTIIIILLLFFQLFLQVPVYAETTSLDIASEAAIIMERSTGKILYEKNSKAVLYPASTTKILTAIIAIENCNLSDTAVASYSAIHSVPSGYTNANIQIGEELTIENLLYALMLKSANEAANILAEHISGSVESFASVMNTKAIEIGCTNTHFVNGNGIHNSDHYSTAYDLALIANYAMENTTFRKIVSTTSYTLPATNKYPNADRTFSNTNDLIIPNNNNKANNYYYKYATGIKTGFTTPAKNCLVASSNKDGLEFVTVVLKSGITPDGLSEKFLDTIKLFNYGYENYTLTKVKEKNDTIKTIEIENGSKDTKNLELLIEDQITVVNSLSTNMNNLLPTINLNQNLLAPIEQGSVVGSITYTVDGTEYTSNLLAGANVEVAKNNSFIIIILGLFLLIAAVLILKKDYNFHFNINIPKLSKKKKTASKKQTRVRPSKHKKDETYHFNIYQ